ncbi:hypothetical protein NKH70_22810 [Mesorhizobium sp. M0991]|uniref:hypothetical protein n=1 Tax=Mesorhizobium sp. M0991 TaxID=2957043 RepID=UPI00333C333F
MGHQLLPHLPRTKEWRHVVTLLSGGALMEDIAAASARAADRSMIDAADDATVRQTFYLLTQIPLAAASRSFAGALRGLGLVVSDHPSLVEIGAAMMDAIDRFTSKKGPRSDYGEIAQVCAVESLHAVVGRDVSDLFGMDRDRVKTVTAGFANAKQFAVLAREFFARLTQSHLNFYLHRELSNHVGASRRFSSVADHRKFEAALDQHCREASGIIKNFAAEWFSKQNFEGGIDRDKAGRFVHVAAGKIRDELRRRESGHA